MAKHIQWRRTVAEGVVIVVSILLAFGVDAWWDDVQDRRSERSYLLRIGADLRATQDELRRAAETSEVIVRHAELVMPILTGALAIPTDTLGFIASVLEASRITDPLVYRSAYDDLVSSGNLNLIRDAELRVSLSDFYSSVDDQIRHVDYTLDQAPYRSAVRGLIPVDVQLLWRQSCRGGEPLSCPGIAMPRDLAAVARSVLAEPDLARKLNLSLQAKMPGGPRHRGFGVLLESIDSLRARIDDARGAGPFSPAGAR